MNRSPKIIGSFLIIVGFFLTFVSTGPSNKIFSASGLQLSIESGSLDQIKWDTSGNTWTPADQRSLERMYDNRKGMRFGHIDKLSALSFIGALLYFIFTLINIIKQKPVIRASTLNTIGLIIFCISGFLCIRYATRLWLDLRLPANIGLGLWLSLIGSFVLVIFKYQTVEESE